MAAPWSCPSTVDGQSVVFRTGPGTKLAATVRGSPVAFEADAIDEVWREGWSVLVQGVAVQVTAREELDRLRRLPLRPWAGGDKSHYVRILASEDRPPPALTRDEAPRRERPLRA